MVFQANNIPWAVENFDLHSSKKKIQQRIFKFQVSFLWQNDSLQVNVALCN